jgi:hypothetical protein
MARLLRLKNSQFNEMNDVTYIEDADGGKDYRQPCFQKRLYPWHGWRRLLAYRTLFIETGMYIESFIMTTDIIRIFGGRSFSIRSAVLIVRASCTMLYGYLLLFSLRGVRE